MRTYTLQDPTPLERQIARLTSGSTRRSADWKTWPDGEAFVRVRDVRDEVCVVGRAAPSGDALWRTMLLVDTLRRTGAGRITLVLPYFAYARQDRIDAHGDALSSGTVSRLLAAAGATRIVTADLHSGLSAEESPVPIESVGVLAGFAPLFKKDVSRGDVTVVSPDAGGRARSAKFAEALGGAPHLAWVEKKRNPRTGEVRMLGVDGDVSGTTTIIVDDMVDTGGTAVRAVEMLRRRGFTSFSLCVTHPVFSGDALGRVMKAGFRRIVVSDTVPMPKRVPRTIEVVSAAEPLARAALQ